MPRTPSAERSRLRWTRRALAALLALYLSLVVLRESQMGAQELYPFASWSLFTWVPNEVNDHSIRLLSIDGRPLDPPIFFEDSREHFRGAPLSPARVMMLHLGRATESADEKTAADLRRRFERLYLDGQGAVEYEIVARRFDPLERWRQGHFRGLTPLGRYRYDPAEGPA
jgi:hypothetical protein